MKTNFLIASGLAVTAIAAKFIYEKFFNKHQQISKQSVIQKLIDTRQHLYPILYEISYFVSQQLVPRGIPPDQAKLYIMQNQQLGFKSRMLNILSEKIYHDIDQESLQYSIENVYNQDKEVQYYKKQFQEQYQKCFLGIQPSMQTTKITIINKQTLLKVVKQLLQRKLYNLETIRKSCLKNDRTLDCQKLQKQIIQCENQDKQIRNQLIKQQRIGNVKNLEIGIARFIKSSTQFKEKYQNLQKDYHQKVNKLFKLN